MGLIIILRAFKALAPREVRSWLVPLGFVGGFMDAIGGGGWGPLVTSNLVGQGAVPRYAIGSTNLAEFFVSVTVTFMFLFTIGLDLWPIIAGLIIGGIIAAPLAAYVTARVPDQPLMILVGVVISLLSLRGILQAFG
ncbi:MAG TPA: TSUP family transporter, partial [Arenibaculum sp.]|nr:TSUP family transporter [Arenibaculum sp.]